MSTANSTITSPNGKIIARIFANDSGRLSYTVENAGTILLEESPLGLRIDDQDLGSQVTNIEIGSTAEVNTTCPWRGVKTEMQDHHHCYQLIINRDGTGDAICEMIWRMYDDGVAFRYHLPGSGIRTVSRERSGWTLPAGTRLWAQNNINNYEGLYTTSLIESAVPNLYGPPITAKLPGNAGYLAITEGALYDYVGMTLQAALGSRTLLYSPQHNAPFDAPAGSTTPWRIIMISPDLNGLVNNTIVPAVNPAPVPELTDAAWIRPGRAMWSWWARRNEQGHARSEDQEFYMEAAVSLGFEYVVWDEGWENWPPETLDALLQTARDRQLGVWLWKRWTDLESPAQRDDFLSWIDNKNAQLGKKVIVGLKIDFMDSESVERIQWYQATLKEMADHQLMVNFHGADKPTGYDRTYPHEMTREGIRGLEYHIWDEPLPPAYNATAPFVRLLAGHADYTPVTFADHKLGRTSYAQQLAMAVMLTSPLIHWADDPQHYLDSPARPIIEAIPPAWDETVVLQPSAIGDLALFARRKGRHWFLAAVNGQSNHDCRIAVPLSFLGPGSYQGLLFKDTPDSPAALVKEAFEEMTADRSLDLWLRPGGGCIAMFTPFGG